MTATLTAPDLYERDRYAWFREQLQLARSGRPNALDLPHLADVMEDLVADREGKVESLARRIMAHLLLLEHSPAQDPRAHWEAELVEFRAQLADTLTKTLANHLETRLDREFARARKIAAKKMEAFGERDEASRLPALRPYTLAQILGDEARP